MARFGAVLNGLANVTWAEGDLLRPVEGRRFDLIQMNPPFVISPAKDQLYRDSGTRGDQFCKRVIREVVPHLHEGGYFQLIGNWVAAAGRDAKEELAAWFDGLGCDTWVFQFETYEATAYATSWLECYPGDDQKEKARQLDNWINYLEREGIEAISYGVITLRRRTGQANWLVWDEIPPPEAPCGDAVLAAFARRDFLQETAEDPAFLDVRVRPSPQLRWEQQLAPSEDGWTLQQAHLRLGGGLGFRGAVDGAVLGLLQRCRGEQKLRDVLRDLAESQHWDVAAATPAFLRVARTLIEKGFLVPAAGPAATEQVGQ
jgi:hypothetical protein